MAAERRAKQQAFEEKRLQKANPKVTEDRKLTLYTASIHKSDTPDVDHTFDMSSFQLDVAFPLSRTALESEIYDEIAAVSKFQTLSKSYIAKIESKDASSVLIMCVHGKHRSVAMAETIKKAYPLSECHHLMLE